MEKKEVRKFGTENIRYPKCDWGKIVYLYHTEIIIDSNDVAKKQQLIKKGFRKVRTKGNIAKQTYARNAKIIIVVKNGKNKVNLDITNFVKKSEGEISPTAFQKTYKKIKKNKINIMLLEDEIIIANNL